MKRSEIFR